MPEKSREHLADIVESKNKSDQAGLVMAQTDALEGVIDGLNLIQEAIQGDRDLTEEDLRVLERTLSRMTINVGGEEMTVEQARKIPDLKKNMEIWQEIQDENFGRINELTFVASEIAEHSSRHK